MRLNAPCNVLVYDREDGSVICRSRVHVVEFVKDVRGSMITLLRHPIDIATDAKAALRIEKK